MIKLDSLEYKRLVRMSEVGTKHRARLSALGGTLLDALVIVIGTLKMMVLSQAAAAGRAREATSLKRIARTALRLEMEAIGRAARAMKWESPHFDAANFLLPRAGDNQILTVATNAAHDAAPLSAQFIEHSLPVDFLETLNTRIGDFERTTKDFADATRARESAATAIGTTMPEALITARRLDAIVRNALQGDANALIEWDRACRFGRAKLSKAEETPPPAAEKPPGKEETLKPASASSA